MIANKRVLVTDTVDELLIHGLIQAGFATEYRPQITLSELHTIIHLYHGLVINSKILADKALLDKAESLRFIARLGSGLEIIDQEYCQQKGIVVLRSPDGNCDAVAEHAMALLLSLAINLRKSDQQVRQKIWEREANRGWELMHKTVGIIGFGYTGKAFAKRLSSFDVKILVYDKYLKEGYASDYPFVQESNMSDIFRQADVLSLHLPSTKETKGMVNDAYWDKFDKQIVLINTSRGNIVPLKDLLIALDNKKVKAAALDVFENEKPLTYTANEKSDYEKLFERDNVLLSPHVAGWTIESKIKLSKLLLDRIMML